MTMEHCRQHLAGHEVPKLVRRVDALPRTASGKLRRRTVRDDWPELGL